MSHHPEHTELTPVTRLLFDSLETGDLDAYVGAHAENCRGVVGNMEPVVGRAGIRAAAEQMFTVVKKIAHHVVNEWAVQDDTVVEATAVYERRDGKVVSLPTVTVYSVNDVGLIASIRLYGDFAPLFAA